MLTHIIIRVPKSQAAFTYFQFEAREGLCFYSTLDHVVGQNYRDIDIKTPVEFKKQLMELLVILGKQFSVEYMLNEEIVDE
jgi:hypothetical protein